jgi:hypothetical protein
MLAIRLILRALDQFQDMFIKPSGIIVAAAVPAHAAIGGGADVFGGPGTADGRGRSVINAADAGHTPEGLCSPGTARQDVLISDRASKVAES